MPRLAVRTLGLAAVGAALGACAQLPAEPSTEILDETTGVTVARLARPIELLVDRSSASPGDPFAYLAPFETNRMGERVLYLWTATSQAATDTSSPRLLADGAPLALASTSGAPADLGLSQPPYARPAPWSVEHVYRIEPALLERLARAGRVELVIPGADGAEHRYLADAAALAPLEAFIAR